MKEKRGVKGKEKERYSSRQEKKGAFRKRTSTSNATNTEERILLF
jgi:hypothetical protein